MGQLKLKDLYIGKTDGYNEFLEYGSDVCRNLFFEYPNLDISKLLDGSVYYICGDKGTGKTMLLKYVESLIADNSDTNFSQFIRFKKDVDEDQRNVLLITAIRNEVYQHVKSKGLEINKPIHDFGIQIDWRQKGGNIQEHPLLKMLARRFQYSEEYHGLTPTPNICPLSSVIRYIGHPL